MNWKLHRSSLGEPNYGNLGEEFTDLLKYVLSLFELWGFSENSVMDMLDRKSKILDLQWEMDHFIPPEGRKILVCDLDGTIADWRSTFMDWLNRHSNYMDTETPVYTMNPDVDFAVMYPEYARLKDQFESEGGYQKLVPFFDGVETVRELVRNDVMLAVFTARPIRIKRIWWDTYRWLQWEGIEPTWLFMGAETRIIRAFDWAKTNTVVIFEDNPDLALRAANSGLKVFLRDMPYNSHVEHENIHRVATYRPEQDYFGVRTE